MEVGIRVFIQAFNVTVFSSISGLHEMTPFSFIQFLSYAIPAFKF
jgi:hypothetical protein